MINEIFNGIQGEGKTQGQYRTFIRMNNCNLRCKFCDTKYTWGQGDNQVTIDFFQDWVGSVVITGGEPCLPETMRYIKETIFLKKKGYWFEIETNGTQEVSLLNSCYVDLWNISPKNPEDMLSPCECDPILLKDKDSLNDYIVKFVIKEESDLEFVRKVQYKYEIPNSKIWLMPYTHKDGSQNTEQVYDLAFTNKYNYSARLHVLIKGNKRGI